MTEPRLEVETDQHVTGSEDAVRSEDIHAADAHDVGGGHDQAHAVGQAHDDAHETDHGEPPPGPIDWGAWSVSVVGLAAGSVVAAVIALVLAHG